MIARVCVIIAVFLVGCASGMSMRPSLDGLKQQVADRERGFARSMADRDLKAFRSFLSSEAIFFSGPEPRRGAGQVLDWWKRYYERPNAPFSWEPREVEVLESGTLALTSGPVRDPKGSIFATFTSIWRLDGDGQWRIVFDKGNEVCPSKS